MCIDVISKSKNKKYLYLLLCCNVCETLYSCVMMICCICHSLIIKNVNEEENKKVLYFTVYTHRD